MLDTAHEKYDNLRGMSNTQVICIIWMVDITYTAYIYITTYILSVVFFLQLRIKGLRPGCILPVYPGCILPDDAWDSSDKR